MARRPLDQIPPPPRPHSGHEHSDLSDVFDASSQLKLTPGQRIRMLRMAHEVSQSELADRLGISVPGLANYEHDKPEGGYPTSVLRKLAVLFNVSADWLLGLEGRATRAFLKDRPLVPHPADAPNSDVFDGPLAVDPKTGTAAMPYGRARRRERSGGPPVDLRRPDALGSVRQRKRAG